MSFLPSRPLLAVTESAFNLNGSSVEWKRLLYYQKSIFGRESGMIDTPGFYLANEGRSDPVAELVATYQAMKDKNRIIPGRGMTAVCAFPARLEFMKKNRLIDSTDIADQKCPELEKWLAQRNYQSLWLVFSSWYPDNPASMYGHTFLRFQRSDRQSDLLDDAVNFGAQVDDSNGLIYAAKGLLGGYYGRFGMMPYHLKINEYNNVESRDLWEYRISDDPTQIRRIVLSLWEVGSHGIDYYYLDENCSWIMLKVLETGDSTWNFMPDFKFWVVPIDTVRWALASPGLKITRQSRLSMQRKFHQRFELLTAAGKSRFDELIIFAGNGESTAPFSKPDFNLFDGITEPLEQRRLTDAMLDWVDFKDSSGFAKKAGFTELRKRLIKARTTLVGPPDPLSALSAIDDPANGHGSTHVRIGALKQPDGNVYTALSWTPALHELLAPPAGYAKGLEIAMFRMGAWWDHIQNSFVINDLGFLRIRGLNPWNVATQSKSWKLDLSYTSDGVCPSQPRGCAKFSGATARGYAAEMSVFENFKHLTGTLTGAVFLGLESGYTNRSEPTKKIAGWFGGAGPSAEIWYGSRHLRMEAAVSGMRSFNAAGLPFNEWKQSIGVGISVTSRLDLRGSWERRGLQINKQLETGESASLMIGHYF